MSAWTYRQSDGKAASKIVPPRLRIPCWKGLGADSEEKREPASDIDTAVVDSLKALDPKWPIREADMRVRPLSAVHMTAGHNALRGSGPGHKPAFENALALVGCPDRRIDRLCITCCSPSQPSHHAVVRGAISSDPQRGWIIVSLAPSHHGPGHSGELVG